MTEKTPSSIEEALFSPLLERAVELAAQWHDRTYRKGRWRDPAFDVPVEEVLRVPVMAHVTAVALIVQRGGWDDATVAAAFLHDVLEDENAYAVALSYERLADLMGRAVADLVRAVTEQKLEADGRRRSWRVRKESYLDSLRRGPAEAAAVSLADKLHNLWSINESLRRGLDVFESATGRRALSAGPAAQHWFHRGVLDAAAHHDDPRLVPMRARLRRELARFEALTDVSV